MPAQLRGSSIDLYSKSTAATNKPVVTGNRRMDFAVLCPWFLGVDFRRLPRMARNTLDKAAPYTSMAQTQSRPPALLTCAGRSK